MTRADYGSWPRRKAPSKKSGMDFFDKLIARELLAPGRFFIYPDFLFQPAFGPFFVR